MPLDSFAPLASFAVGIALVLFIGLMRRRRGDRGTDLPSEPRAQYTVRVYEADVTVNRHSK